MFQIRRRAGVKKKSATWPNVLYIGAQLGSPLILRGAERVRLEMAGLLVQNWWIRHASKRYYGY